MKTALLALVLLAGAASAQHVLVAPEVTSVTTLGRWQDKNDSGSYRVVVIRDGWEHVWSRVYVEWLKDPSEREDSTRAPMSVQELVPPGIAQGTAVLEATARPSKSGAVEITVRATSNMEVGAKVKTFIFAAGQPGVTKLVRGAAAR